MNPKHDQRKSFISRKITPKKFAIVFKSISCRDKTRKIISFVLRKFHCKIISK